MVSSDDEIVLFRIFVTHSQIWEETQCLMVFDGEADLFGNIWADQLRAPLAMICFPERLP
jgi:hypothetical protein